MAAKKKIQIVYEDGKPVQVIIDIKQYRRMLDDLDELEDIRDLEKMRKKQLKLITLSEYLAKRKQG